ncbi:MAG: hypothetical protein GY866_27740 [Proteobacteria bacterium]|nr:hypothetical protein [Pseudomonadota bacterium]
MKSKIVSRSVVAVTLLAVLLTTACRNSQESADSTTEVFDAKANEARGVVLYDSYCAGCHLDLERSTKAKRSGAGIQYAIENNSGNENEGYMGLISGLLDPDDPDQLRINRISVSLKSVDLTIPSQMDGELLYGTFCEGCHGDLAASDKAQRNTKGIVHSGTVVDEMSFLSDIPSAAVDAVAASLAGVGLPEVTEADGDALYSDHCRGCHGEISTSKKAKRDSTSITYAITNVEAMTFLSFFTAPQTAAIASKLSTSDWPTISETNDIALYGAYCQGCHGELNGSDKAQRTRQAIVYANTKVAEMGFLTGLSSTLIDSIALSLARARMPDVTETDGTVLYASYCKTCHNVLSTTNKPKRRKASIIFAVNSVEEMEHLEDLPWDSAEALGQTLATAVVGTKPTDGTELYGEFCKGCHGDLANSDIKNANSADITGFLDNDSMDFLKTIPLTSIEIDTLALVLSAP